MRIQSIFKRKRNTINIDKKYINFLKELREKGRISEIDVNQNVFQLFNNNKKIKVISMPFTGPSYISNFFNIQSCFYDPTGKIINKYNDKLNVIKSITDLSNFIND